MPLLVIYVTLFSSQDLDVGCRKQIGKWSEISVLNVLKLIFTKKSVRIWSIVVGVFLVILVGLFTVWIKLFWEIKFK